MLAAPRSSRAARGVLARLVAVAVLAGLFLAQGVQCSQAMAAAMHGNSTMSGGAPTGVHNSGTPAAAETLDRHAVTRTGSDAPLGHLSVVESTNHGATLVARAVQAAPGSPAPNGLLATCLILIVAVAAAGLALRPTWRRIPTTTVGSRPVATIHRVPPQPPSLAQLCLLRT